MYHYVEERREASYIRGQQHEIIGVADGWNMTVKYGTNPAGIKERN